MRLIYLGTPDFAVAPLQALVAAGHEVVQVVTPPARPAGRGRKLLDPAVAVAARELGLPVLQTAEVSAAPTCEQLAALRPDAAITVAFGQYLRRGFRRLAPHGVINIHPSLLPRYRGASPVMSFLLSDDEETGVSVLRSVRRMDAGPVLAQRRCRPEPGETGGELTARLVAQGAELLVEVLAELEAGGGSERPQDEVAATHCRRVDRDMAKLVWDQPVRRIARQVQAFNPWPVAWTLLDGRQLRVWRARPAQSALDGTCPAPGTLLGPPAVAAPQVRCADGALELLEVQLEGKRRMPAAEVWRGLRAPAAGIPLGEGP